MNQDEENKQTVARDAYWTRYVKMLNAVRAGVVFVRVQSQILKANKTRDGVNFGPMASEFDLDRVGE